MTMASPPSPPTLPTLPVTGLILAGGRGSRMGLVDKGLQTLHGQPLCQHVLTRLAPQVGQVLINANQNLERYQSFGMPVLQDTIDGFAGPLAGMHSGLQQAKTPWLLCVPVDSPFLAPDLADKLLAAARAQDAEVAVAVTCEDGREQVQPVFCLLQTTLLPRLEHYLMQGGRKIEAWFHELRVARVMFADNQAFCNINTTSQLQHAHTLASLLATFTGYNPADMPVAQAQAIIQRFVQPVLAMETVPLDAALGRVLAQDILSPINVPAHNNSAMDGFALRHADIISGATLQICGTTLAGKPWQGQLGPGQCVRIMTGGVMPPDADSVIPQEMTRMEATQADGIERVNIPPGQLARGDNVRLCGEDLQQGQPALCQGKTLQPAELGLLASLGQTQVSVVRRLRVAIFSTGDELRAAGSTLDAGCIYDSNRTTLRAMLSRLGCEVLDLGIVPDQPDALEAVLCHACENADAIITSGGVSAGEADYTRHIMAKLGEVAFWRIAMRPGRPMAFGRIQSGKHAAWLFGLPGNPVAVMVTFYFFARAALQHMMGGKVAPLPPLRARAQHPIRKKPGRTEYQRGILSLDEAGLPQVKITGSQGSGILSSMSQANCLIVLAHEQANVAEGEQVAVLMFEGLI